MSAGMPETLVVIDILAKHFGELEISYYVGGSVASSLYGIFRATNDADIIVDLQEDQVDALVAALEENFYVDRDMILESLQTGTSFNVIHLPTMIKADLFPSKRTPFGESEWSRRRIQHIRPEGEMQAIYVASPEDMVLQKLNWYRLTGERSDRQWGDVQGILKVQGSDIDVIYLRYWAAELNLTDLLDTALDDAGFSS